MPIATKRQHGWARVASAVGPILIVLTVLIGVGARRSLVRTQLTETEVKNAKVRCQRQASVLVQQRREQKLHRR